ncbi:MAG: hypothetical protein MJ211_07530 [Bacteroidales bacterium]|nr:hypothetical protein [Bacteroidales bacterium]
MNSQNISNDYVIVNGKRYYALGGNYDIDPSQFTIDGTESQVDYESEPNETSSDYGHSYYLHLDDDDGDYKFNGNNSRKAEFIRGRNEIGKYLENYGADNLKREYGIDLDQWNKDTDIYADKTSLEQGDEGFNNKNSRRVYYFLADKFNNNYFKKQIKNPEKWKDKDGFYEIPLGKNITKSVATFNPFNGSYLTEKEIEAINNNPELKKIIYKTDNNGNYIKDKNGNNIMKQFHTYVDDNNNLHVMVDSKMSDWRFNGKNKVRDRLVSDGFVLNSDLKPLRVKPKYTENKVRSRIGTETRIDRNYTNGNGEYLSNYDIADDQDDNNYGYVIHNLTAKNKNGNFYLPTFVGNRSTFNNRSKNYEYFNEYSGIHACGGKKYACGGHKYAYGGETEDVGMPLNMPQGYNAINEGGMHEQNPNGGVPYGMNSDGSLNLVEEGEASVGNNIIILFKITCKNLYKTIKLKKNKTINKNQNITHKKKSFQNQVLEGLNLK